jgi:hypothetical protein
MFRIDGIGGAHYSLIFGQSEARVEFSMSSSSKELNKALFDYLSAKKEVVERAFGDAMEWRRMDDKKASIIAFSAPFEGYDKENWLAVIEWLITHMKRSETCDR